MADDKLGLHIDTDWKKQAQEEKRRLAAQEKQRDSATAARGPTGPATSAGAPSPRAARELPPASFAALVQSVVTQILFYLGDLTTRGAEPTVNLDMAKHHIDTLSLLEEKTKGNLTDEEQRLLDSSLYETRMRYVNVASQYIS